MILLRLISWPYARQHLVRCLLTIAGIVLGVAVFVAMHTANQSVMGAFHETIDRVAGATQLQVTAGDAGFDEDVLDRVRDVAGVRAAAPVMEATVPTPHGNLLILGVDMLGDRSVRNYDMEGSDDAIDDPLVFLAQPDSLLVTKDFAVRTGLSNQAKLALKTMAGDQVFTVRGIMKPGGLASAFGGNLAIMDIYAAQKMFGRGKKFDRIDVVLDDGVTLDSATGKLQAALGAGFQVDPPSSRGEQFEATARTYRLSSNITSLFALFIGMFIIYNTFVIAVTQRRSEIGILRALGATRRQIAILFLLESSIAGLAGTAAGVGLGILMAHGMASYVSGMLSDIYGLADRSAQISLDPLTLSVAVALGLVTSLAAAVIPARQAAGVDPVKALQKGSFQLFEGHSHGERKGRLRLRIALGCGVGSLIALLLSRIGWFVYASYALAVLTAILLTPWLSRWLAAALRPVLSRILPVEGTLAADSLLQAPRRTSGTVAALMLSIALAVASAGIARASYYSIAEWMRIALSPDLFVTTADNVTARTFVFPASLGEGLRSVDGVGEVQLVRSIRVSVKGAPVMVISADVGALERRAKLPAIEGNQDAMYQMARTGKGFIVSENFARLRGGHVGDVLDIPTPNGILSLPIAGVVRDFSDQQGSVVMQRDVFTRYWHDDSVNLFRVYLKPGADESVVRERIIARFGSEQRLFVMTNQEIRNYITRLTDQWFALTYVQIAVAVLVAVLGIVNALTVSITDRRRELGVLQAVGGLRSQIRRTIWMEAGSLGVIGLVLGLGLGAIQLYYTLEVSRRVLLGTDVGYTYPGAIALALIPVMMITAFLAALGPAEQAVRGSLVEALEYE